MTSSSPSSETLSRDASVIELMRPIKALIDANPGVTEITMSTPGEFFLAKDGEWERHHIPSMNFKQCLALAESVGFRSDQSIGPKTPLLSATLPDGERMQIVVPPAVEPGSISFSIRIPSSHIRPLSQYASEGVFKRYVWFESSDLKRYAEVISPEEQRLCELLANRQLEKFLMAAVLAKKKHCRRGGHRLRQNNPNEIHV